MAAPRTLALVLAGGAGSRMELLTERRAKPALPYAGLYRLIDFPLTNCHHSRVPDVWVLQQYQLHSLNNELANGRPWDLDRTYGGLRILPPQAGGEAEGFHEGNADALWRNRELIAEAGREELLVMSADAVYTLDYERLLAAHRERGADVTMVTTEVSREEATRLGVVQTGDGDRVTGFQYKPGEPATTIATIEVFAYRTQRLLEVLEDLAGADGGLEDFGHALLPRMVEDGNAFEYRFDGYWRDVGTVDAYWESHMDLVEPGRGPVLADPDWPMLTLGVDAPPSRIEPTARLDHGLVSSGCTVAGAVGRSVLSPGVVVEEGATVTGSVLLHDVRVRAGARVERAVVDQHADIGPGATVGGPDGGITLVGEHARVGAGARVEPGTRVPRGRPPHATG